MENSPSSSSNGSPAPGWVPAYHRLSSEVVEKPFYAEESQEFHLVPGPEVAELSPAVLPGSPASKSDSEGILYPIFGLAHVDFVDVTPGHSDAEMEQGDEDEGFDEEFEDKDINEPDPSSNFKLEDLDPKELQQLLDDPHLPNLEDFDLGVDVLDSEQPHAVLSSSFQSYSPAPSSPYHNTVSPAAPTDMTTNMYYNDYNLSESFCSEDPPSVQSTISALTCASLNTEDLSLAMLTECDTLPDSTSSDLLQNSQVVGTTVPGSYHSSPHSSPVLTSAGGLDLSETSQLLSEDTLIELSTALSSEAIVDTQSMYMFGNGSAHLNILSPTSQQHQNGTSTITLLDSAMLPVCPQASHSPGNSMAPAPSTAPRSPGNSSRRSPSPSPARSPNRAGQKVSAKDQKLIDLPYYQFRKLLDDPSIPDSHKEDLKNIRRKGRNKMAAKMCRTKKMSLIMGLEQEVEQLKKAKSQIALKTLTLEREVAELKKKCLNR